MLCRSNLYNVPRSPQEHLVTNTLYGSPDDMMDNQAYGKTSGGVERPLEEQYEMVGLETGGNVEYESVPDPQQSEVTVGADGYSKLTPTSPLPLAPPPVARAEKRKGAGEYDMPTSPRDGKPDGYSHLEYK